MGTVQALCTRSNPTAKTPAGLSPVGVFHCLMEAITVSVKHNMHELLMELEAASREMRDTAVVRALNKTADQVKVQAARAVRDAGYGLKVGDIKKALRVQRASQGNLRATVIASGRPISLMSYGARQTSKGVSVNVQKGRKLIAGAFIATMPSGKQGVFVRDDGGKHRKVNNGGKVSWHQLPIRMLFGPAVPDGMANAAVQEALQKLIVERFPKLLQRESAWLSRKLGAPSV